MFLQLYSTPRYVEEKVWSCQLAPLPRMPRAAGVRRGPRQVACNSVLQNASSGCCFKGSAPFLHPLPGDVPAFSLLQRVFASSWKILLVQSLPGRVCQVACHTGILFFRCIISLASCDLKSTQKINKGILFSGKGEENLLPFAAWVGKGYF